MDSIDLSLGQHAIIQDALVLDILPEEILEVIRIGDTLRILDAIAAGSLLPALTLRFFTRFENVFADICARWIALAGDGRKYSDVIEAFAQIITFAPHLSIYLERFLHLVPPRNHGHVPDPILRWISGEEQDCILSSTELQLQRLLLAVLRLINFDKRTFAPITSASRMQSLLGHSSHSVRYLAIRIICRLLSASDKKMEEWIDNYVGKVGCVMGYHDDKLIDYGFLSLYEEKRVKNVEDLRKSIYDLSSRPRQPLHVSNLSPLVSCFEGVLLPRPNGKPNRQTTLVPTETTLRNKASFAKALLSSSPILIHGLPGSGKTSLVNDFARELGKDSTMVTLHLNEQTDAKMLIGMYSTSTSPGSFMWRPGVLTTAVREGRWVFIEDLDRAPNEVISVILPLIERGELFIPSRGEIARATPGFRLIASIRTSSNIGGKENPPAMHMLGARLWNRVHAEILSHEEFLEIIGETSPILHDFLPGIRAVFERLCAVSQESPFSLTNRASFAQPVSPRGLLKWCRRLNSLLVAAGLKTGDEPITETTKDEMFMEAIDCFAGNLQFGDARKVIIYSIAEEMHIPVQRVQHYLEAYVPRYDESDLHLQIGRVKLSKRLAPSRVTKSLKQSRPFADTTHARRLLEQVGVALKMAEPVLLVGETGIGKTTVVQQLADLLGYKLTAVNLSQQSEAGDLLGGFKPISVRSLAIPLKEEFDELFVATGISANRNQKYLEQLGKCIAKGQWNRASKLWHEAPKMFERILSDISELDAVKLRDSNNQPAKRRKAESKLQALLQLKPRWEMFSKSLDQFDAQLSAGSKSFAFAFIEGNIVRAARNGEWVLLDEINLAPPDTLECIADLLHSGTANSPSILITETGKAERIRAHPDFRIFGAMNPATDVGKRDLPVSLQTQFTEIYVESPDRDLNDLHAIIQAYLKGSSSNDERAAHDIARLYVNTKRFVDEKRLVDGANQVPCFSLRTLTRVLSYAMEVAPSYGLRRALYEGYAMGFLTLLDGESGRLLTPLMNHHLFGGYGNAQSLLAQTPKHLEDGRQYIRFMNKKRDRQYWMLQGHETPQEQPHYIITPFVERNMLNLVRATSTRRFPILVQGPTSSGKTSMIEYLAKFSGNKFVRINNHEHTDLQEYLGSYTSGSDGQLQFQEGLLVKALREGHWIVLDELNLAPTDVLEALNRLLDDNRELLIPETQEVVRPHKNFMLFATQNPPGLYGGRKVLSRAFRNRFLELHFDDIPEDELEFILEKRSQKVAPSDCKRIVTVYKELSRLRQSNRLFEKKDSFATLRDLFRWASRDAENREQLAAHGYMLLAERVRRAKERIAVKDIIEKVMKVKLDPNVLYAAASSPEIILYDSCTNKLGVVWTHAMRRLYILVAHALRNNEPVLLVGETGCGKTTVCQMLAEAFDKKLSIVNAHQNTETGDLIGSQRPIRNHAAIVEQLKDDLETALYGSNSARGLRDLNSLLNDYQSLSSEALLTIPGELNKRIKMGQLKSKALFEWCDGSLIQAMREGQHFLLDEISLADDSVLERLNSVLEPQRTILLAEKGVEESFVRSADGFQFFATMNPGGDYGKRELSPALRNRFTEIWVPPLLEHEDILQIVEAKLTTEGKHFAKPMVDFADWFGHQYRSSAAQSISVRDLLSWVSFINYSRLPDPYFAVLHGAAMVYIDTIGANPAGLLEASPNSILDERAKCLRQLSTFLGYDVATIYAAPVEITQTERYLTLGNFSIEKTSTARTDAGFAFEAPTTKLNAMRVARALQVQKPILIEGSPGVGKTTLITALAKTVGMPLTRINLSEQTDLMDLFGSDTPVEGGEAGKFAWRDAPFLQAMQKGDWVLLDEMNLASQSVLEGLNACLDHRGEVYISELDKTFHRHQSFCVFATQNPHHQGGGRKGLPSSFVNRFTVVYADVFRNDDLTLICRHSFPKMNQELISSVINFVCSLEQEAVHEHKFGAQGAPWEFNLRDILRWLQLLTSQGPILSSRSPADFLNLIFRQRFRTVKDRQELDKIFVRVFRHNIPLHHLFHNLALDAYQVGMAYLPRNGLTQILQLPDADMTSILPELESIMMCVQQNIPCILVGSPGSGKSTLIQHVAAVTGAELLVFPLNTEIDTMDLVGGFEQVDPQRKFGVFMEQLCSFLETHVLSSLPGVIPQEAIELLYLCRNIPSTTPGYSQRIRRLLVSLYKSTSLLDIREFLHTCQSLINSSVNIEGALFEWVDGILIKAIEEGKWLVLDNANLCSSSVLDRLNSLLEPNGLLSINENNGLAGEPRIVIPHSNFRIFLTMDPRFGELSRAMRNRCIEIYLGVSMEHTIQSGVSLGISHRTDTTLQRYRCVVDLFLDERINKRPAFLKRVVLDHLSLADTSLLPRFSKAAGQGLIDQITPSTVQLFQHYFDALQTGNGESLSQAISKMYEMLSKSICLSQDFKDAQTIHPLQDSPLVPLLQKLTSTNQGYWLGSLLELQLDILIGRDAYKSHVLPLATLKPTQMNRLQRSMARDRVTSVSKDSTARVDAFLMETLDTLDKYVRRSLSGPQNWKVDMNSIRNIMQFWWETYHLVSSADFEEATFQAHLAIGGDLFKGILSHQVVTKTSSSPRSELIAPNTCQDMIRHIQSRFQANLNREFRLTTGLSMELLWLRFRPTLISKDQTLQTLINLEGLAIRFDSLRWRVPISVSEQSDIVSSFVKAHQAVLICNVDGQVLIETMSSELDALEGSVSSDREETTPFFSRQFETLRQYQALRDVQSFVPQLIVLANHPTISLMHLRTATKTSQPLQAVNHLWGQAERILPLEDTISASLLSKLSSVGNVNLGSLRLLETELPILGQHIANESASLCQTQVPKINLLLSQLIEGTIEAHNYRISEYIKEWTERLSKKGKFSTIHLEDIFIETGMEGINIDTPHHVQEVLQDHIKPALVAIAAARAQPEAQLKFSSLAWIHFAIGCIVLYVPDRPFDPDKKQRLELQQHQRMKQFLEDKLTALRQFEVMFTGQNANIRSLLLEEELRGLGGPVKAMQEIFRPDISEIDRLQGEFNNLLNTILSSKPHEMAMAYLVSGNEEAAQRIRLLQSNLVQIIRRLSERFRSYSDMTVPLVGMLRCLQVGLFMADTATTEDSNCRSIKALSQGIPFLGGGPMQDELSLVDHPLEALAGVTVASLVEGTSTFSAGRRRLLFDIFHSFYNEWRKQLDADRKETESKTSLYRFRGSADDEEEEDQEEFSEMFLGYNDDSSLSAGAFVPSYSARDTAIALSDANADIFLSGGGVAESTLCLIRRVSKRIGNIYSDATSLSHAGITKSLLPGVIVMFNDQLEALYSASKADDSFNFYTDPNLREVRKLVGLVHQIQNRFQELQKVDEIGHMQPLADVTMSCTELLKFRHTEPLAKIITKVEKIHGFMHEWQFGGWASRANSVLSLYNDLTSTIISWRRLELSTWAKLFDMEGKRCGDDAKSWWFIAYEVVIAVPLSMAESESRLRAYAQKLLQELETYFASSIQGQFIQRLQLIKQLQKHLELLVLDLPLMAIILAAVSNFAETYTRYKIPVEESIRKGRQTLEKAMRDVLLLASWKDTNIAALRDSARRSHYKLFKLVRKHRALLGQPMETILKQGLPDNAEDTSSVKLNIRLTAPIIDKSALALCERGVRYWSQKSKRFRHVSRTVSLMDNSAIIPDSALQAADYLESFLRNIITSTAELRKATPSLLTEDNKDMLTHLKLRKRKLFADTLKEVRQMGINYNLGTSTLEQQNCLSAIISVSKQLNSTDLFQFNSINYYYHQTLDLIPQARAALRQHSQDLTRTEVVRSVGFLEGLLRVTLKQRDTLASITANSAKLQQVIRKSEALSVYCIKISTTTSTYTVTTKWLSNMLTTGLNLVKMHDKLGDKESTDVQRILLSWIEIFESFTKSWESLPDLPKGIKSTHHDELERQINNATSSLRQDLTKASKQWPNLEFILLQIIPWTVIRSESITRAPQNGSIIILDQKISKICDSILVAVENLAESIADLPNSSEDPSWLIKADSCLGGKFGSNYGKEIVSQIHEAFETLASLDIDDHDTGKTVGALFAVALPIFQQYRNIFLKYVERYAQLHHSTCKLTYILTKIFTNIASDGFCTPSKGADAEVGKTDKLEEGTGLGEGEGAEDISNDIQNDEDLSELGQEQNGGDKEMEDERDAVDMADGDMEGEMGDADERGEESKNGDEEAGDEIDEEAGSVDDLDPNAVDEKMWDGEGENAEKNQETDKTKGKANEDEQAATKENKRQVEDSQKSIDGEDGKDEEEELGAEQGEEVNHKDIEEHDPRAQEGETLELPDEMELDGPEQGGSVSGSDGKMDELSDLDNETEDREDQGNVSGENDIEGEDVDVQENQDEGSDLDIDNTDKGEDGEGQKTEDAIKREENQHLDNQEGLIRNQTDNAIVDLDDTIPSNTQGIGEDQDTAQAENETPCKSAAQRDKGGESEDSSEQREAAAEDGGLSRQADSEVPMDRYGDIQENNEVLPFKKLGDLLEKWYRQQTEIREATEQKEDEQNQPMDASGNVSEFKHLQDEDAEADTQAMGTATEDQARAVDESMAIDTESKELPEVFQPDEVEEDEADENDIDIEPPQAHEPSKAYEGRAGAMMRAANTDHTHDARDIGDEESTEFDKIVHEVDNQLSSTSIGNATLPTTFSATRSRQLWAHYESITRDLSFALTEQLRLILAPTVATRMRGDFRTGKRLNIKRIIPYIASQYKRDKIWMRRSVPSKRSYQILIAVDDSKSMTHSGSGLLAFETLVMVSRSLSMLEIGQVCVVGFGENVNVAHEFETPFSADSGPKIFQSIGFQQNQTNVTRLVRESIEIFRAARAKASRNPADLWQLELIISDGVCNSSEHETIRRLLREAIGERIMIVFVIVDDLTNKKKGESVMDLKEAKFVKDEMTGASNVKIERYLDTFPFQYYLIVSDVKELPGVLAALLRQWFAEVAESS